MNGQNRDGQDGREAIDFAGYWQVILKRKWTVLAFAATTLAVAAGFSFFATPAYKAEGKLLIEREPNILSFNEMFQIESFNDDYFQTQYQLLQSRTLVDETIDRLKLYENPKFVGKPNNAKKVDAKSDRILRGNLYKVFVGRLKVIPVRQTRLVNVTFSDSDPEFAAVVLNTLFNAFIDMNVETKYEATKQASEFLTNQINTIRSEIEENEKKFQQYGAEKNIIALSDKETTVLSTLEGFNKALTDARIDLIQKETFYNEIKGASPDFIPQAINNALIQRLREDYARLSREYEKKKEIRLPDYPEMKRLKAELEAAKNDLEYQTQSLIRSAYSDYQSALRKYQSLGAAFNKQKEEAIQLNNSSIMYNSLKMETDNKKSLLESLLKRQSETGVSARLKGLRTSNVRIVDKASAPARPSSPKKKLNIVLGLLIGLLGGLGLTFFFEYLDDSIKGFEDVERFGGLPTLGAVPAFGRAGLKPGYGKYAEQPAAGKAPAGELKSIELIAFTAPHSSYSENYRSIRTTLLLAAPEAHLKTIIVTSPLAKEGKSTTLSNLGITLAQAGKRVIIIDADLRNPSQHKIFNIPNRDGLTNFLTGGVSLEALLKPTDIPHLIVINAGPVPPNPMELLSSNHMTEFLDRLKKNMDYVLVDTPPVLAVSDAMVLGPSIDRAILVVEGGKTPREALRRAREKLDTHRIKCLGVIINNVRIQESGHYYGSHYYKRFGKSQEPS
jgi:succinoglycan biosynthesis transport protein ExoP